MNNLDLSAEDLETITVKFELLGKEYCIQCPRHQGETLKLAGSFLDKQLRKIRNSGKVISNERIAIMAALNITHDLLTLKSEKDDYIRKSHENTLSLQGKIEKTMARYD